MGITSTPTIIPRRIQMDDAAKASNAGAVAKSGSTNALAAASAKQFGVPALPAPPSSILETKTRRIEIC